MLQTIREHTQGWIAGTIIGIIILTFALWGIHSYFVGGGPSNIVAEVNGVEITKEQLAVVYERLRRQVQMTPTANQPGFAKNEAALKKRALQGLIGIEVLKQAAVAQGFWVFDNQIDRYLQTIPEFQVNGQFSVERFQEVLASSLLSTSEFLELVRSSLLIDQPKLGILFSSFALPNEIKQTIAVINQERDIDYITIPFSYFLMQPISISPAQTDAYYRQHQKDFMTPEQASVDYVSLSVKDLEKDITPNEQALNNAYNDNIGSYTSPMQWKLVDILIPLPENATQEDITKTKVTVDKEVDAIKASADFNKLIQKYPGELNGQSLLSLNQFPAELQPAIAELKTVGQVSEPIQTPKGFVIIKALEVKEPEVQSFDQVKDKVKEAYVRQRAEEKFAALRDQLADITYEHPDSLDAASKALNLPIKTSESFTKEKGGVDISQSQKVRNIAFSNDVLNLRNNSDVIPIDTGTVVVIHIKNYQPAKLLPLADVSKQIEDNLKMSVAEANAKKTVEELESKLKSGATPQALVSNNQLTWTQVGYTGRYNNKVDSAVLDTAFRLPNPALDQGKVIYGSVRLPDGYAIVALKAVRLGTMENKDYNVFAEQVQNSDSMLEYELYKQSQMNSAKIKILQ